MVDANAGIDELFAAVKGVDKEGWLTKEGRRFKSWKRRWFRLEGSTLSYYSDRVAAKPKGSISLESCAVQQAQDRTDTRSCMELITEGRKLYFQADTEAIAHEWALALNNRISCLNYVKKVRLMKAEPDERIIDFFDRLDSTALELCDAPLPLSAIVALAQPVRYNRSLTEMALRSSSLGDLEASVLADSLAANECLTRLDLSHNELGDDGAASLATALMRNPSLAMIDLSFNAIGDAGFAALAGAVPAHKALRALHMEHNECGDEGAVALADACKQLASDHGFAGFFLSHNRIGDAGGMALAAACKCNGNVAELVIEHNALGDDAALALASAVADDCASLSRLLLADNRIGDMGVTALATALDSNSQLEVVTLGGNADVGEAGLRALSAMAADFQFVDVEFARLPLAAP